MAKEGVSTDDLEGDVDVEQSSTLLHDHPRVEARPHLDVVGSKCMGGCGVEGLGSDLLELQSPHHRVEEDLQEVHVVTISGFHDLDPLESDLVLGAVVLSVVDRQLSALLERVHTGAPVNVELQLLLELVPDAPEHILAELLGVVGDLRVKLAGVLVDTLNASLVEVDLEVVGVHRQLLSGSLCVSCRLLRE